MTTPSTRVRALTASLPLHVAALLGLGTCAGVVLVPATAHAAGVCVAGTKNPTATVTLATKRVALGEKLTITGTDWCDNLGTGSRIGVKLDEGGIEHPAGKGVHQNLSIWAVVQADDDGTFTAEIQLPDGTATTSSPALKAGEHTLRLLSGSLKDPGQDQGRTVASEPFTVTAAPVTTPEPPTWAHQELPAETATAWVEDQVATGDAATLRIKGHGWTTTAGRPSTVAVKLNSSSSGAQYQRTGADILKHPKNGKADATLWALITPARGMNADGTFEVTLNLPTGLVDGQYVQVALTSGLVDGDVLRSKISKPLQVGTTRGKADALTGGVCTPTSTSPTVKILTPTVAKGGTLRISGTGWCHPEAGGSTIGVKIDEGAISHLDSTVHSNRTIWAVVRAQDSNGTFTADITLPDGTTQTSTPALATGAHTLRLLSGSLKAGDAGRTLLSGQFVVGSYRPNGYPAPFDAADLTRSARGGVHATVTGRTLRVRLADGRAGDWVHLSAYLPDGSPRNLWQGRWYRLDARGEVTVRLPKDAPTGRVKVVVTDGNQATNGTLRGWAPARFPGAPLTDSETSTPASTTTPSRPGVVTPAAVVALVATAVAAPIVTPEPPAKNFVALGVLPRGTVAATLKGDLLTVAFPALEPGDLVHTRLYGADEVPAGWGTLTAARTLVLNLSKLPAGTYRIAFQNTTGTLLGWHEVEWAPTTGGTTPEPVATPSAASVAETREIAPASAGWQPGTTDGILLGVGAVAVGLSSLVRRRKGGVA